MSMKMAQGKSKIEVITGQPLEGWAAWKGRTVMLCDRETGEVFSGSITIKPVRCGKPSCTKCPHHSYAYAMFRRGKKVGERYLGVAR